MDQDLKNNPPTKSSSQSQTTSSSGSQLPKLVPPPRMRTFNDDMRAVQGLPNPQRQDRPSPTPAPVATPRPQAPTTHAHPNIPTSAFQIPMASQMASQVAKLRASRTSFPEPQEQMGETERQRSAEAAFRVSAVKPQVPPPMAPKAAIPKPPPVPKPMAAKPIATIPVINPVQQIPKPPTGSNPFMNPAEETLEQDKEERTEAMKNVMSPIHTYTTDVAHSIETDHTSIAKIAIAEDERRIKREEKEGSLNAAGKNVLTILLSLFLLAVALGIGYYFLFIHKPATAPVVTTVNTAPADILGAEKQSTLSIARINHAQLLQQLQSVVANTSLPDGQIDHVVITNTFGQETGMASTTDLFALLQTGAPGSLIRSFDDGFYFGIYDIQGVNQPFLILSSNSYSDTVAGMLAWEKTMIPDLQSIFLTPSEQLAQPFYTETASSTQYVFTDAVISNKNVRVVRSVLNNFGQSTSTQSVNGQNITGQNVIFLYSMIDQNTLIITTNPTVFQDLLNRLIKATFVR